MGRTSIGGAALALVLLAVGGCTRPGPVEVIAGPPDQVIDAYLRAVEATDCDGAKLYETPVLAAADGGLCGKLEITDFRIDPANTGDPRERSYFTQITTPTGFADGSVEPGLFDWFIFVERQPDGAWLVSGGGSSP